MPGDPSTPILYEVDRVRDGRFGTKKSESGISHYVDLNAGMSLLSSSGSFSRPTESMQRGQKPQEELMHEHEEELQDPQSDTNLLFSTIQ